MIDLHAHLLPDWDDGAKDWEEMLQMAEIAFKDGIRKIVLTPHIYRLCKHGDDMGLLEERMAQVKERAGGIPLEFYRGAEVFVHHELVESIRKYNFTINNSDYLFIEFPSDYVLPGAKDLFFSIMLEEFIPIISHPERNAVFMERPELLFELITMGSLAQVTAKSVTGEFGPETKKVAHLFLRRNLVHFIASDAHDARNRPPRLKRAVEEAGKVVGEEKASAMVTEIPQAILNNEAIPNWGEPENPEKKKWTIRIPKFKK